MFNYQFPGVLIVKSTIAVSVFGVAVLYTMGSSTWLDSQPLGKNHTLSATEMESLLGGMSCPYSISAIDPCVTDPGKTSQCNGYDECQRSHHGYDTDKCFQVIVLANSKCVASSTLPKQCSPQTSENFCSKRYYSLYDGIWAYCPPCDSPSINCSLMIQTNTVVTDCVLIP